MHPWHDVALGSGVPEMFPVLVEVPMGSKHKDALDKATGLMRVDRVRFSAVHSPSNYGVIPQTSAEDHDPLDVLVLGQEPVVPLALLTAKASGLMQMRDQGERADKIIAGHVHDPDYAHYNSIFELPAHRMLKSNASSRITRLWKIKPLSWEISLIGQRHWRVLRKRSNATGSIDIHLCTLTGKTEHK